MSSTPPRRLSALAPGLAAAAAVAGVGWLASRVAGFAPFSPAAAAYLSGAALRTGFGPSERVTPGLAVSQVKVLRVGIVLLGFQLNGRLLVELGLVKVVAVFALMALTLLAVAGLARLLRAPRGLAGLLAVGTAVCGASAIAAAAPVLKSSERESGYAIATVTLLGSLLTLLYPLIAPLLNLSSTAYGFWAGASLHEMAHAISAGFAVGRHAGETATIVKLLRVAMLAPALLLARRLFAGEARGEGRAPGTPLFLVFFLAAVVASTVLPITGPVRALLAALSQGAVCMAMAAIGLRTDVRAAAEAGPRPLGLALAGAALLSATSLAVALILRL